MTPRNKHKPSTDLNAAAPKSNQVKCRRCVMPDQRACHPSVPRRTYRRPALLCPMCGGLRAARRGQQSETQPDWKLRAEIGVDPASKRLNPPRQPQALRRRPRFNAGRGLPRWGGRAPLHPAGRNSYAIQSKKRSCAPNASWRLAGSDAGRSRPGHRGVCKDRWRASEGDSVAREFGHNDAALTRSRRQDKGEQGKRGNSSLAEGLKSSFTLLDPVRAFRLGLRRLCLHRLRSHRPRCSRMAYSHVRRRSRAACLHGPDRGQRSFCGGAGWRDPGNVSRAAC